MTELHYYVVVNHEEQYSIWPDAEPPAGWDVVGEPGTREACLARIEELWTDMRPRSLREFMASAPTPAPTPAPAPASTPTPSLVERLAQEQDVELELFGAEASTELLRERLASGIVHLRFPGTRGGTVVAISLDESRRALLEGADELELTGRLELDFQALRCEARVRVADLRGRGRLVTP